MNPKLVPFPGWEEIAATKFPPRQRGRNKLKAAQYSKEYRRTHPTYKARELRRLEQWKIDNPEKNKAAHKKRKKHQRKHDPKTKEQRRLACARRNSRKKGLPSTLTTRNWRVILDVFANSCAYCDKHQNDLDKTLHKEHVIPMDNGGGFTITNIIPACFDCNVSKGTQDMRTWLQDEQRYEAIMMSMGDSEYLCQEVT